MIPPGSLVLVVDDDRAFRDSMQRFLRSVGLAVEAFSSPREVLARAPVPPPACALVDLRMPEMTGLELQKELARLHPGLAVVFVTGRGDVSASVQAMRAGAVDFVEKPFDESRLLEAIERALGHAAARAASRTEVDDARGRLARLTPRERQVCDLVAQGLLNKQTAAELGMSENTVKVHRSRLMVKLDVASVADLVRLVDLARRG